MLRTKQAPAIKPGLEFCEQMTQDDRVEGSRNIMHNSDDTRKPPVDGALLPCPFCGGPAEIWRAREDRPSWIACMGQCVVLVTRCHSTDAAAIASWNTRKGVSSE